jgi:structural maintenance of chromosome 2
VALLRFDTELCELDGVIKTKNQAASDTRVTIEKLDHEVRTLAKEKVGQVTAATTLEKPYEWIVGERQWVNPEVMNMIDRCALLLGRSAWYSG